MLYGSAPESTQVSAQDSAETYNEILVINEDD